jgi:hypothetical protein
MTLIGLFCAGLLLPSVREEAAEMGEGLAESEEMAYRKTA